MQPAFASEKAHSTEAHSATTSASSTHDGHASATGSGEHGEGHSTTAASTEHSSGTHETTANTSDGHGDGHSATKEHGGENGGGGHGETIAYHPPGHYLVGLGPTTFHLNTLIATWIVMGILITVCAMGVRKLQQKPDKKQVFFETVLDFINNSIVATQVKHDTYKYVPLVGTLFLFILISNWIGLMPWRIVELFGTPHGFEIASPTNDLNTNGALALIALASYWVFGLQKKGLSHFKHYFQPMWWIFPLNFLEDLTRPLSLSFRLFGNVIGGEIVIGILVFLMAPTIVGGFVALPMMALEFFVGFIQAFIFAILTASYIGAVVAEHH